MHSQYIALIRKEEETDYGVDFPDFPGCITAGRTLEEARAAAIEALEGHAKILIEDGHALPEPSSLDRVMAERENRDTVAILVPLGRAKGRAVRVNITLDEYLLREIDATAASIGMTRSAFIADASRRVIEHR